MGILSPLYDASFAGVSFWEQGAWYPGIDVTTDGTLISLTGGTHVFFDMGRAPLLFEIEAGVEAAQRTALEVKRGDSGTLVWSRGSHTCTLLDITPKEADAVDGHTLTLRFFTTDLPSGGGGGSGVATFVTELNETLITEPVETLITEA